jgi:hypothetical protein
MHLTELPAPAAAWTLAQAVEHYRTFTAARLATTRSELQALGADAHPAVALGLAALAQLDDARPNASAQTEALDLARDLVCTDAACLQATSHVSLCECRGCRGADHGSQQDRTGLIPAGPRSAQEVRSARAMRALVAALPDESAF